MDTFSRGRKVNGRIVFEVQKLGLPNIPKYNVRLSWEHNLAIQHVWSHRRILEVNFCSQLHLVQYTCYYQAIMEIVSYIEWTSTWPGRRRRQNRTDETVSKQGRMDDVQNSEVCPCPVSESLTADADRRRANAISSYPPTPSASHPPARGGPCSLHELDMHVVARPAQPNCESAHAVTGYFRNCHELSCCEATRSQAWRGGCHIAPSIED